MKFIVAILLLICGFVGTAQSQQLDPSSDEVVYVVGNVVKPLRIVFREGLTLTQAVQEAGGLLLNKKYKSVFVYRLIPNTKDRKIIEFKLKAIQKKQIDDFLLQPLDVVEIKLRKKKPTGDYLHIINSDTPTIFLKIPNLNQKYR